MVPARDKQISWDRDAISPNRSPANPGRPTPNRTGLIRSWKQLPPESTFRPDTFLRRAFAGIRTENSYTEPRCFLPPASASPCPSRFPNPETLERSEEHTSELQS